MGVVRTAACTPPANNAGSRVSTVACAPSSANAWAPSRVVARRSSTAAPKMDEQTDRRIYGCLNAGHSILASRSARDSQLSTLDSCVTRISGASDASTEQYFSTESATARSSLSLSRPSPDAMNV